MNSLPFTSVKRKCLGKEDVVNKVFDHLVEQAAAGGLLDLTYSIDSTDVRAMPADQDASKCYDPTDDEYYLVALCLRLIVAITNYERGDNPGSTIITV